MNFLLSGYYGYRNAGDEAVLAAILSHLSRTAPQSTFTVTSGDLSYTQQLHDAPQHAVRAVPRQNPKSLLPALRACDVFISGGGSLLQDVTSLRNIVYYTALLRFAQLSRKPTMIYAQGIGPLLRPYSQKLTRIAAQRARIVSTRDEASRVLLERIGVRREIHVTADPVWALIGGRWTVDGDQGSGVGELTDSRPPSTDQRTPTWCVSLRSWPGVEDGEAREAAMFNALRETAQTAGAQLQFLPMQPQHDGPLVSKYFGAPSGENWETLNADQHPRAVMAQAGVCDVMIAMRLHALIFAAAQNVPCVAIDYDPKVAALARILDAPLLRAEDLQSADGAAKLLAAVEAAKMPDTHLLQQLRDKAIRNAEMAADL